jgi:rhodanese-related sulfurtransferase
MQRSISFVLQLILSITLLSGFILGLATVPTAHGSPYTDINVTTAYDMINNGSYPNLMILDVRTQSEYDEGHIGYSISIPVSELETMFTQLPYYKNNEIIVYDSSGAVSAQASSILDANNFTKVYNMLGGITAWKSASYPVIPEFPSLLILPLLMAATLLAVITLRRRQFR